MNTQNHINRISQPANFQAVDHPSLVAYFFIDTNGLVQDFDVQTARILNIPDLALKGIDLIAHAGDDRLVNSLQEALSGKTIYHRGQISIVGKQPLKNFATYLRPIFHPANTLIGVAGFIHYARQGIVSPFEMGQQAEYFNLIANSTRDIISLHSLNGKLLFLSPSFEQFTGMPHEKMMHNSEIWPVYPDDKQIVIDALESMKTNSQSRSVEYRYIKKDKSIGWVESTFQIVYSSNLPESIATITRDITSRKEVEKALQISETKYRNLMMSLPTGVVLLDLNGKIIEANDAFFRIICRKANELDLLPTMLEFDREYKCDIVSQLNNCIEKRQLVEGQHEFKCDDGKTRHIQFSLVPLPDTSGKTTAIMGNVRDLTDLINAEEESRQQVDFLNMVINTLQEPFFVKDENHRWVMLNDANIEMIGQARENLLGKSDYDIFPKEQADVFWAMDDLVLQKGSNLNEEQITWSNGGVRTVITSKYLYHDKFTGKKYIVGNIHDITHLKEIQKTLKRSEQKYHDIFQNANDLIFTIDLKGNFTNGNQRITDSLGLSLPQLLNTTIFDIVKNIERPQFREILVQLLANKTIPALEVEVRSAAGNIMVLEVHGRLMFENDTPVGIQGIARDISDKIRYNQQLNRYNEELKELNESKDKMFSIIAHDLKDPFNSLLGFSEILLDDFDNLDKVEMRDYIKIINNTAKHSLNLLENLLTWSRLLTGRLPFTPMKLTLTDEVESALTIVSSLAYRKRIAVNNNVPRELMIKADQNMILSIFHNFIMNAIKFTNPGGHVDIDAHMMNDSRGNEPYMFISITDNGIGMNDEEMSRLFKINALYSTSGTQNEKGTGLGLLLTREMVERHGGEIHVESKPGQGSVFSFTVPASK